MKKKPAILVALLLASQLVSQSWQSLPTGVNGAVNCMTTFNNELWVGGEFNIVSGIVRPYIAKWDGNSWQSVGTSSTTLLNGVVRSMCVYNNELYICGDFSLGVAKWSGTNWIAVGTSTVGLPGGNSYMAVYNNELLVSSSSMGYIHKWNGTTWSIIGHTAGGMICVYNNTLFAAGNCTNTGVSPYNTGISKWNGTSWANAGGIVTSPATISDMCVHNNELYVTGTFNSLGGIGVTNIARYNGTNWSVVNTGPTIGERAILSSSGFLYVSGHYWDAQINNYHTVMKLSGSTYTTVGSAFNPGLGEILSLCAFNNIVYAAGSFQETFGTRNNIIRLNGSVGLVEKSLIKYEIAISPNPSTGVFTLSGLENTNVIEIFDVTGRSIYKKSVVENKNTIDLSGKDKGIYLYKITNAHGRISTGRLVVE